MKLTNKIARRDLRILTADDKRILVAALYVLAVEQGGSAPLSAVADRLNSPTASVRTWLRQARENAWMSPAEHGKAGGKLTSAGLAVLRKAAK